jgi:hypothetical protein
LSAAEEAIWADKAPQKTTGPIDLNARRHADDANDRQMRIRTARRYHRRCDGGIITRIVRHCSAHRTFRQFVEAKLTVPRQGLTVTITLPVENLSN